MGNKKEDKASMQGYDRYISALYKPARQRAKKGLTKQEIEKRREKARVFVGKRIIAGGRVGRGVRVDPNLGNLVVEHATTEGVYDPNLVTLA